MFNKSILNDIRDRIPIAAFIGERVPLKRSGRNFKGLCPFHQEKTPSFMVSDEKQLYHCFGCGEGGDVFQFMMKFEGLSFAEAVKYLAERAGVEIPKGFDRVDAEAEKETTRQRRMCLRVNEIAREFFAKCLADEKLGGEARKYLQRRGITREIWTQHFLGYADKGWDSLASHLQACGVPLDSACALGLVRVREGGSGYYDFFRHRLMFPIISPRGEVLGFGGRVLEGGGDGVDSAKYINSPDSLVYHKSNCVYGLDRAAQAIRVTDQVILVEGYMDLIALHQAGIANVVAPLGTALTEGHLRLISRYTRNFVVIFDGDEAGSKAATRALPIFIGAGLMPRVVPLPRGEDPDTLVRKEGPETFLGRLKQAPSLFEYFVDCVLSQAGVDATGKVHAMGRIVPVLKLISDPVEGSVLRDWLARRLGIDERAIAKALSSGGGTANTTDGKTCAKVGETHGPGETVHLSAERTLIEAVLKQTALADMVFGEIGPEAFSEPWSRTVAKLLYDAWQKGNVINVGRVIDDVADAELAAQLRAVVLDAGETDEVDTDRLVKDCILSIKGRPAFKRLGEINEELRSAETSGNEEKMFALLEEKRKLAAEIQSRR